MRRFLLISCLLLALRACAQPELIPPTPPPEMKFGVGPAELKVNVSPELDGIDPRRPETMDRAWALLPAKHEDLATLRALAGKAHQIALDATAAKAWHAMLRAQAQEQIIDRVIMKTITGSDLPGYLWVWVGAQIPPDARERYRRALLPLPARVIDERLDRCFPEYAFYVARYPLDPVKPDIVPPLAMNNLFAVKYQTARIPHWVDAYDPLAQPEVTLITAPEELKAFFLVHVPPVILFKAIGENGQEIPNTLQANTASLQDAAAAWLLLAKELRQDGYYRFAQMTAQAMVFLGEPHTFAAAGVLQVQPTCGNSGALTVRLHYDRETLQLQGIEETATLQPGIRPTDQARKLLDPAVRKQAEDDLRLMGPEAFDYLMRARAAAPPALQGAIDKVWNEIGKAPN